MQRGWDLKFKFLSPGILSPTPEPRSVCNLHTDYDITVFAGKFTDLCCCSLHSVNLEIESSIILCIKLCNGMIQRLHQLWAVNRYLAGAA